MNDYHALTAKNTLKELKTSHSGLKNLEVKKRQTKFGPNAIKSTGGIKWWQIAIEQFTNIMVIILIAAMVVSALIGEEIDAIAIGIIIALNAIIGFIQEFKAEKAIEALKKMAAPHAIVIRNQKTLKIPASALVPGDIIVIEEGMQIPADARLIEQTQLKCSESSLTGESNPVAKDISIVKKFNSIGDLNNMVFMGTVASQGHGQAVVTSIGMKTEFGKIAHMVQSEKDGMTPLQKQLDHLSKILAALVLAIAAGLFGLAFITGRDLVEIFLLSISLAVSVIPEGLPAVITLTLAIGVQKIAKKNAIIRKLPAAETLGSTSVICSDKTGTLTQNQMTVKEIFLNGNTINITGIGYNPKGKVEADSSKELDLLMLASALCNNANLLQSGRKWGISGDPTEGCLLTLAKKSGLDLHKINKAHPRSDELIFDSQRKRMSTLNKDVMYTKGAADSVLSICSHIQIKGKKIKLTAAKKRELMTQNDTYAKNAYRVLGFAYKQVKGKKFKEDGMVFIGMVGMIDPARPEVKLAIQKCHDAHIKVIMITGDHALTAKAIGEEIRLYKKGDKILTGAELEKMTARELKKIVEDVRIYARVNPEHKVIILKALQKKGHIVAMTGDGVNDAPALQSADIGVAMGITGTDVAKEAAEMILVDDNFATIVNTIESGRVIYRNIKKFVRFLLSANFDEIVVISVVFLMGMPIPFLPLQILWVNLLTDALPAIALGTDIADDDIMKLEPRNPKASIWKELISFSALAGLIAAAISLFIYFKYVGQTSIEHTRTLMFTTVVMFEMMLVFSVRFSHRHYFTHFFKNKLLLFSVALSIAFQLFAIYSPIMQPILQTVPLTQTDWQWILGLCAGGIAIIEIWKTFQKAPTHV